MMLMSPTPIPSESWPGYLLRFANANLLNGIPHLARIQSTTPIRLITGSPSLILKHIGVEAEGFPDPEIAEKPNSRALLGATGRTLFTRVCPKCIQEMECPFIPSYWDRALSWKCLKHDVQLIERCPQCNGRISYFRHDLLRCNCGFRFSQILRLPLSLDIRNLLYALSLDTGYPNDSLTFSTSTVHERDCVTFLQRIHSIEHSDPPYKRSNATLGSCFFSIEEYSRIMHWFADWPNGFQTRLLFRKKESDVPFSTLLGHQRSGLNLRFPKACEAIDDLNHRQKTMIRPSTRPLAPQDAVGIKYLMKHAGVSHDTAVFWINAGRLGEVRILEDRRYGTHYAIPWDAALHAIRISKATSTFMDAARVMGLSLTSVRNLSSSGILQTVPFGPTRTSSRLIPLELFEISKKLIATSINGRAGRADVISLDAVIAKLYKYHPKLLASFVQALLSAEVAIRRFSNTVVRLDELMVRVVDLNAWRRSKARRHGSV